MNDGPTAVGYVRVNTGKQASDGVSLDAQHARIDPWCTANGRLPQGGGRWHAMTVRDLLAARVA